MTTIEYVNASAMRLDALTPGWAGRIDFLSLDLGSCKYCILGQVFGSWGDGVEALGFRAPDGAFDITGLIHSYGGSFSVQSFKDAWIDAIADRRCRSEQPPSTNAVDLIGRSDHELTPRV